MNGKKVTIVLIINRSNDKHDMSDKMAFNLGVWLVWDNTCTSLMCKPGQLPVRNHESCTNLSCNYKLIQICWVESKQNLKSAIH